MAITQLNRGLGAGGAIGASFGTGLGSALEGLAQGANKRAQGQQFQQEDLPAILAQLDPQVQAAYLRQFGAAQQMAQQQESQNSISNLINQSLGLPTGQQGMQELPAEQGFMDQLGQEGPAQYQPQPEAAPSPASTVPLSPGARAVQDRQRFESAVDRGLYSPDQVAKAQERLDKRADKLQEQQNKIDAANKDYFEEISNQAQGAQEADNRLERMQQLILQGKLPYPATAGLADLLERGIFGIGLNVKGALYSPDAQEFEKLSQDFLKNAKKIFGSRVTEGEVRMFLKTVPSLAQSDAGKERLISNMQLMNQASELKYQAAQDIIGENEGYQPANLRNLVEKRVKPELEALHKQFSQGLRANRKFVNS